ncbi:MAG: S8 family serine peptidase, partial [Acidobacteriaceae bacterium]
AENGMNLDASPVYPICDDQGKNMVLGVAATDLSDQKAPFSNFGNACVDISAPGKMILTTGYLPSDPSDNVLIYGSGTSLAAPLVSGVAALMKSNRPELSNTQIRDIILRTADNIDSLNLNNCLSKTCSGLLGRGRLNAMAALSPQPLLDGSFVRQTSTNKIFRIVSGSKQYVSPFVFQQRGFDQKEVMPEYLEQLNTVAEIPALPPIEGTLIKSVSDPTVYVINDQLKRPLTYTVFVTRNFRFSDVKTMPEADVAALKAGDWYWPPDGTLVLVKGDPTVFVMNKGSRRAVTYFVFTQRKLSFARVMQVTPDEFSHIPKAPDAYWLPPLEGTLVKSASTETVYLIQNESRKPLSAEAFVNRKFKFSSIKSLPQAEIEVIMPGSPIFN